MIDITSADHGSLNSLEGCWHAYNHNEEGAVEELEFSWEVASPEGGTRPLRFSTALFPPLRGTALYPLISKANHSCVPNCMLLWSRDCAAAGANPRPEPTARARWRRRTRWLAHTSGRAYSLRTFTPPGTARLVATQPLAPGEELTIDYLANGDEDEDDDGSANASRRRKKWLKAQYGFVCKCERCRDIS